MDTFTCERRQLDACLQQARQGNAASADRFWSEYAPLMEMAARRNLRRRAGSQPPHVKPSPSLVGRLIARTMERMVGSRG